MKLGWEWRYDEYQRAALLQATSILSTAGLLILWSQPLTLKGHHTTWPKPRSVWQELVDSLNIKNNLGPHTMHHLILSELHRLIITHESETLRHLRLALDRIDAEMGADDIVRDKLQFWRKNMGVWKPYLHSRSESVEEYGRLQNNKLESTNSILPRGADAVDLITRIEGLNSKLKTTTSRCEVIFNSLIGTMNLIESKKAITEAEQITKLTQLAFFFILLTFVTGFFGMNLKVSTGRLV